MGKQLVLFIATAYCVFFLATVYGLAGENKIENETPTESTLTAAFNNLTKKIENIRNRVSNMKKLVGNETEDASISVSNEDSSEKKYNGTYADLIDRVEEAKLKVKQLQKLLHSINLNTKDIIDKSQKQLTKHATKIMSP